MKSVCKFSAILLFLVIVLSGCKKKNQETTVIVDEYEDLIHNSRNSLDYEGTYTGIMPCADCEGIRIELTLMGDSYTLKTDYLGKDATSVTETGFYTWDPTGNEILLDKGEPNRFQVGENQLFILDEEGNQILGEFESMYILRRKAI